MTQSWTQQSELPRPLQAGESSHHFTHEEKREVERVTGCRQLTYVYVQICRSCKQNVIVYECGVRTYVFTFGGLKNLSVLCLSTVRANSNDNRQLENTASTFARSNLQEDKKGID